MGADKEEDAENRAVRKFLLLALAGADILAACSRAPTAVPTASPPDSPSVTPTVAPTLTQSTSPIGARPEGYVLPAECRYVDNGAVDGRATTWKISCPGGLPSNYLQPSLAAQAWVTCGTKVWQKSGLQISVIDAVNVSGFTGWLDQRQLSGGSCIQAPPPPQGSAGPP